MTDISKTKVDELKGTWWLSQTGEHYNYGPFATRELAIEKGRSYKWGSFSIGQAGWSAGINEVDVNDFIENMAQQYRDEYGECADEWPDVGDDALKELGSALDIIYSAWIIEHKLEPKFFMIENDEEING